jgi:predicted AAA+ superfamily ATPase
MTTDERLDRLTERHEALTQSVEMLLMETRELRDIATKHAESLRADDEHIRALVRIAEIHDPRLTDIEGGE